MHCVHVIKIKVLRNNPYTGLQISGIHTIIHTDDKPRTQSFIPVDTGKCLTTESLGGIRKYTGGVTQYGFCSKFSVEETLPACVTSDCQRPD